MEEYISTINQAFNLGLWIQLNTKLEVNLRMAGGLDFATLDIWNGKERIVEFELDSFSQKSKERVELELKRLIAQLLEIKNNTHYTLE